MTAKPDFDQVLQAHINSIENRDINQFKLHITKNHTMYTIVQNGYAFTNSQELVAIHEEWFKDKDWTWKGSVVHKVVGNDMAFALIKYDYQAKKEDTPFSTWLTYVFKLEDNEWRIIHDHNTTTDFRAFAQSAGIKI